MTTTSTLGSSPHALSQPLVERCMRGDEMAWVMLYREHHVSATRFLLRLGVKHDVVEDTCQEVFLQAFRFLPQFRGECSFRTWLYRICASEARRARRKSQLKRFLTGWLAHSADESTAGEIGDARAVRLVGDALEQLTEAERLVFVLYELEGLSGKDVSIAASCPEATVFRRLHYARKHFKRYISDRGVSV